MTLKEKNNEIMYVAILTMGDSVDYRESNVFCSVDKNKVENWVNRFNNIINNNRERINKYECCEEEQPFWYDYIKWENPYAIMEEIPIR